MRRRNSGIMVNGAQIRAARALLDWHQDELATRAGVARKTLTDFEREIRVPTRRVAADLVRVLEAAGIRFVSEEGLLGVLLGPTSPGTSGEGV